MKHVLLLALLCAITFSGTASAAHADHGSIGAGVVLGIPTGLSGKFWLSQKDAIDVALGWNFEERWFALQTGYLYNHSIDVSSGFLAAYIGVGGLFEAVPLADERPIDKMYLSGRIPLGLEYIYEPISFFAEVDPLLSLYPGLGFHFGGGVGFRFYF